MDKIKELGQIYTSEKTALLMISLIKNNGTTLEPSCGDGIFLSLLKDRKITALEIDKEIKKEIKKDNILNIDFFDYSTSNLFDTIIGNPPYVEHKSIITETKNKLNLNLFNKKTNLYLFFIEKCIKHLKENGELIFIVPRDFTHLTSAIKLNEFIYKQGTITDFYDLSDTKVFEKADIDVCIFRFQKGNFTRKTNYDGKNKTFIYSNGILLFTEKKCETKLKDVFDVKVGAVSGKDEVFLNEDGIDFVFSKTKETGKTRRMIYRKEHPSLLKHKNDLLKRKIKQFDESNWWDWGRPITFNDKERIYVNCKTRKENPFFYHSCKNYDGSMLALFPKKKINLNNAIDILNKIDWKELGLKRGGRFCFTQRTLENIVLPDVIETTI